MRKMLLVLVAVSLALPVLPGRASAASAVDCGPDDGRDRLTSQGFALTFDAPAVAAPEVGATTDVTGNAITPYHEAVFPLLADLAPNVSAAVTATLDWANPGDFDLYVFDSAGELLAGSDAFNVVDGTTIEQTDLELAHCDRLTVVARNWTGSPDEELSLSLSVTPGSELLACVAGDTAPGCAGKAPGQAPDFVPDTRTRLYLGGDPGAVAMLHGYPALGSDVPFRGRLEPARPTGGVPNSHTRPLVGFRDQYQNPFVPHFTISFDELSAIQGDVTALLWISSKTEDVTGTLYADLYADGGVVASVPVRGDSLSQDPAPVAVTFPGVDVPEVFDLTLQVATTPVATSTGQVGNPADAEVTVHYGSVQFPSRVTLP